MEGALEMNSNSTSRDIHSYYQELENFCESVNYTTLVTSNNQEESFQSEEIYKKLNLLIGCSLISKPLFGTDIDDDMGSDMISKTMKILSHDAIVIISAVGFIGTLILNILISIGLIKEHSKSKKFLPFDEVFFLNTLFADQIV